MPSAATSIHRAQFRRRALLLLFLGALPLAAPAAEVLIEPRIGFGGVFQLGRPFPLEVRLNNIGRTVDGVVEVEVWKRGAPPTGAYPARYRREVFLPARANRTVSFTVDPELLSRPLTIRFNAAATIASRELDLRGHFSPAPLVLSVSGGGTLPLTSLGASFTNRIVSLSAAALPPDARALAGVSHLVLYDQSLRDLAQPQLQALDDWLVAGGQLVIVGSLNFALYQEPKLARFLPARVTGVTRIGFVDPSAASDGTALEGVWAHTVGDVTGRTVIASRGLPLLVENGWGRGRVIYLALDAGRPPLSNWAGLPRFLQGLLAPPAALGAFPHSRWDEALFSRLLLSSWFIASYIPTRALFFALLLYLAGLAVLLYLWRRQRSVQRKFALWCCWCCGWILCAAATGYLYFSRGGRTPEGVLIAATVMDDAGGGYVDAQTNLALFSTQRREYSLGFGPSWLELTPLAAARAKSEQAVDYRHLGAAARVQLPLEAWGHRLLHARHVERAGLRASIELRDGALLLEVHNRSSRDLSDCWLVAPGLRIALGEVPSGGSLTKSFPLAAPAAAGGEHSPAAAGGERPRGADAGGLSLRAVTFKEKAHEILFHDAFFAQQSAPASLGERKAVFFGWVKDPQPRVEVGDQRVRAQQYTLYRTIVHLPHAEEE
jgi:hypothetical protein